MRHVSEPRTWVAAAVLVCALAGYASVYALRLAETPDRSDGLCHYLYLPALVVHGDSSFKAVANERFGGRIPPVYQITWRPGTNRWLNAHQGGVALLCLPFFLGGRAAALALGLPADGFSFAERHAAGVAGTFYLAAGLYVLGGLLARRVRPAVVAATLLCITFGTNLFHYATYDSLWTHVFSFFLFAVFLDRVEKLSAAPSRRTALLLGAVGGLIGLVRLPNLALLLFVPLYDVSSRASARARARFLRERRGDLALAAAVTAVIVLPQLLMFRAASGSFWSNPYGPFLARFGIRRAFDFGSPHLLDVLFSPAKGLFFWSPILALSVVGLVVGRRIVRPFLLPTVAFVAIQLYVVASWYDWQLGGSFGHRGFTETLAVFAIPMAALFEKVAERPAPRFVVAAFAGVAVALSLAQMTQYWLGILPISDTTLSQYRALFLRF